MEIMAQEGNFNNIGSGSHGMDGYRAFDMDMNIGSIDASQTSQFSRSTHLPHHMISTDFTNYGAYFQPDVFSQVTIGDTSDGMSGGGGADSNDSRIDHGGHVQPMHSTDDLSALDDVAIQLNLQHNTTGQEFRGPIHNTPPYADPTRDASMQRYQTMWTPYLTPPSQQSQRLQLQHQQHQTSATTINSIEMDFRQPSLSHTAQQVQEHPPTHNVSQDNLLRSHSPTDRDEYAIPSGFSPQVYHEVKSSGQSVSLLPSQQQRAVSNLPPQMKVTHPLPHEATNRNIYDHSRAQYETITRSQSPKQLPQRYKMTSQSNSPKASGHAQQLRQSQPSPIPQATRSQSSQLQSIRESSLPQRPRSSNSLYNSSNVVGQDHGIRDLHQSNSYIAQDSGHYVNSYIPSPQYQSNHQSPQVFNQIRQQSDGNHHDGKTPLDINRTASYHLPVMQTTDYSLPGNSIQAPFAPKPSAQRQVSSESRSQTSNISVELIDKQTHIQGRQNGKRGSISKDADRKKGKRVQMIEPQPRKSPSTKVSQLHLSLGINTDPASPPLQATDKKVDSKPEPNTARYTPPGHQHDQHQHEIEQQQQQQQQLVHQKQQRQRNAGSIDSRNSRPEIKKEQEQNDMSKIIRNAENSTQLKKRMFDNIDLGDRDQLLATMMAESEYVDPPLSHKDYIALLNNLPPLRTVIPYNRLEYFARSSIPIDITPEVYAQEGIEAAISSRLPPYSLHKKEYELLKHEINHLHVATYLNIRNGILRLWKMNHNVTVTRSEAAGCSREPRFFGLAEAAFEFLVRHGYINFGVIDVPLWRNNFPYMLPIPAERRSRLRIVVIGAGISGLGSSRQIEGLFKQYDDFLTGYEASPEIIVLEARSRIGGRIYSAPLQRGGKVDLGAQIVTGFSNGNPMSTIIRKQMGIECHELKDAGPLADEVFGGQVSPSLDRRAEGLFNDMLDRISVYRTPIPTVHTVQGDIMLISAGKDPTGDGGRSIARIEENAAELPPLQVSQKAPGTGQAALSPNESKSAKMNLEIKLENLGFDVSKAGNIRDQKAKLQTTAKPRKTLGQTMDEQLKIVQTFADLSPQDLRLLNWHYANLEYANATPLKNLSLGSWDQDDGNEFSGRHTMLRNGYMQVPRALYLFPSKMDVRFKSVVQKIKYDPSKGADRKSLSIVLESGETITADRIVCTVPLGVLKSGAIEFDPPLPEKKQKSINDLGFGTLNKVILVYDSCFWDIDSDIIGVARSADAGPNVMSQENYESTRGRFCMFWNATKVAGQNCLIGLMTGNAAYATSVQSDESLVQEATYVLSRIYPGIRIPRPIESIVTRWHCDPFSLGSYSYVGPDATGLDYEILSEPAYDEHLFFAGEATSRTHPATVHGAYLSGLRAAEEVFRSVIGEDITLASPLVMPQQKPGVPSRAETVVFPSPPKSAYSGNEPQMPQPIQVPPLLPLDIDGTVVKTKNDSVSSGAKKSRARPSLKQKRQSTPTAAASTSVPAPATAGNPAAPLPRQDAQSSAAMKNVWNVSHYQIAKAMRHKRLESHEADCDRAITRILGPRPQEPQKLEKSYNVSTLSSENWYSVDQMNDRSQRDYRDKLGKYERVFADLRHRWLEDHKSTPEDTEIQEWNLAKAEVGEAAVNQELLGTGIS
ncbi:flavin-containing amine oxidoreductase-domain containing protein [Dipodascopsis uninucleata]